MEEIVDIYNTELKSVIDLHAPIHTKQFQIAPIVNGIQRSSVTPTSERRQAERRMRKTELAVDRLVYREKCSVITSLLFKSKTECFSNKISELGNHQNQLRILTNNLMGKKVVIPMHKNSLDLSNSFNTFFINKIETIRNDRSSLIRFCSDKCDFRSADVKFKGDDLTVYNKPLLRK